MKKSKYCLMDSSSPAQKIPAAPYRLSGVIHLTSPETKFDELLVKIPRPTLEIPGS